MDTKTRRRAVRPTAPEPEKILIRDREGAFLASVGLTKFAELQREPGFPPPVWLGKRTKRHDKLALLEWLAERSKARRRRA